MATNKKSSLMDEKKKIIGLVILIFVAALIVFSVIFAKTFNPLWVMVVVLAVQYIILVPLFATRYRRFFKVKKSISSWIPLFNELNIFSTGPFIVGLVGYFLVGLSLVCGIFTTRIFGSFFYIDVVHNISFYSFLAMIVIALILEFPVIGAGWMGVRKRIYGAASSSSGFKATRAASEFMCVLLLFIPLARLYIVMFMLDDLVSLVDMRETNYAELRERSTNTVKEVQRVKRTNSLLDE